VGSAFGSAGGSGDEGSAGAAGGPAAGSGGAAGAAGAPVPSCPDADADGTCDDADECPAGSDADADDNGYADACEQPLWTIAQHGYKTFDFAANIHPCDFHFDLTSSGTNCATHQVQSQFCTADGAGVDEIITERSSVNIPEDFSGCTEFTPSWRLEQQPRVNGPVSTQAPHHIAYLRVQATGSIAANAPNYTATIDVTWTAYGY
jgi:hypothetical protein